MFPVKRNHRLAVLIQIQKAAPAADHWLGFGFRPVDDDALETLVHIVRHGDFPRPAGGFRVLNDVLHVPLALKLVIDTDFAVFHVQVSQGQPYKLRNAKSRLEQDINAVVVPGKVLVTLYKFQKCPFLFSCNRFPCHTVVNNDGGKLKLKRIFAYQIIVHGHLKRGPDNAPNGVDGTVSSTILL